MCTWHPLLADVPKSRLVAFVTRSLRELASGSNAEKQTLFTGCFEASTLFGALEIECRDQTAEQILDSVLEVIHTELEVLREEVARGKESNRVAEMVRRLAYTGMLEDLPLHECVQVQPAVGVN